ncbi:Domain of unknown function DUF551 [uncultured Caudovirales phage]|uniref:DUF551 domain-containing protein n=1 Tax=uncultured Caudovirales phage TaxID=2100421 RepID=A0A6J5S0S6_9CAUD|nr:Domain of unknown function DUF551 [uncultured Caudovirales phage]
MNAHSWVWGDIQLAALTAAAEIERLRALTKWQPIETAPRDGTRVLIGWAGCYPSRNHVRIARFAVPVGYKNRGWTDDDNEGRCITPTHWMPLPKPPQ